MGVRNLSDEQIENRLAMIEGMMVRADSKDLPYLNATYQKLIDEQVLRDIERGGVEYDPPTGTAK